MITASCEACGNSLPITETYTVLERRLCIACAQAWVDEWVAAGHEVDASDLVQGVDPTVCSWCQADSPDEHAARIADLPTCEACDQRMRNFPFPTWVKASFALLLVAAVVSFAINARFLRAYLEFRRGARHVDAGEFVEAADLVQQASKRVPESRDLYLAAGYMRGRALLAADNYRGALQIFQRLVQLEPNDPHYRMLLAVSENGVAFDDQDYDKFLQTAQVLDAYDPGDAYSKLQLASAYACLYAARNDRGALASAHAALADARQLPLADPADFEEYSNRVLHRIASREIIRKEEYDRRFPHGWKPPANQSPRTAEGVSPQRQFPR